MNRRSFIHAPLAIAAAVPAWGAARANPAAAQPGAGPARLSGATLDGQPYDLSQDAGKVVLVFFWSTGCAVCRDKMPELRNNYAGWVGKGFQLVAVNTDKALADAQAYDRILARTVPMRQQFPSLWRGDAAHRDGFGALAHVPTSFLVDRKGVVVKEIRGRIPADLWDDVAELVLN